MRLRGAGHITPAVQVKHYGSGRVGRQLFRRDPAELGDFDGDIGRAPIKFGEAVHSSA
jgi:hypothetical protein